MLDDTFEDDRIAAWYKISYHPFFEGAWQEKGTLLDAMIRRLDAALGKVEN